MSVSSATVSSLSSATLSLVSVSNYLENYKNELGHDDPDTLNAIHNLAEYYYHKHR